VQAVLARRVGVAPGTTVNMLSHSSCRQTPPSASKHWRWQSTSVSTRMSVTNTTWLARL